MRKTIINFILIAFTFQILSYDLFSSPLDEDDELIFYPSNLYLDSEKNTYKVLIHAHVFEKKEDSIKRKLLIKYLNFGLEETDDSGKGIFKERSKWFLVDNKRGKEISIELLGKKYSLNETEPNGRSLTEVVINKSLINDNVRNIGYIEFSNLSSKKNKKVSLGRIHLVEENSTCLISDIDDTLKISDVRNKKSLVQNTFVKPFQVIEGMSEYYNQQRSNGTKCFVNVSASPWQMFTILNDFFSKNGFPLTVYQMKDFRMKDSDFFNLFEKPEQYKFDSIDPLIKEWKKVKFILVGDTGEKDPEAYANLAMKYPEQVKQIFIRIAYDENLDKRIESIFEKIPKDKYKFFKSVSEIR
ncbi:App1 family protein [Leptospira levettii]|uniref:phosphatidate phosphatase App1 family protein n=1 Tax=Leptospira levettii TaxID=2023178 RepID=UPI00223CFDFD|nr:App1 family protein [Leptospira levettii]MCW7494893.1 App1 family protein [Leptospira levettii]